MKVQVKGLVFVGFAAAVFAQSAMAEGENKIVTSKQYVDSKIVGTSSNATTIDSESSDTDAPSMLNVYKFVTGQVGSVEVIGDNTYTTTTVDTTGADAGKFKVKLKQDPASARAALTGELNSTTHLLGTLDTTAGQKLVSASAVKDLLDAETATNTTTISSTSENDKVPTSKNVYDFVTNTVGSYQPKAPTTDTTSLYLGHNGSGNVAEWNKLEAVTTNAQASTDYVTLKWNSTDSAYDVNLDSGHIAATSALTGTTATNDTGLVTAGSIRSTILQAGDTAGGTINATTGAVDTTVPTTRNVYEFVTNYAQDNYQPKILDSDAGKVMIGYNTQSGTAGNYTYSSNWSELVGDYTVDGNNQYIGGYIEVAPNPENSRAEVRLLNVGHTASAISSATSSDATNNKDKIASAYAVQQYVTGLLGGLSIPQPSAECSGTNLDSDDDGGCALVMAWDSTAGTNGSGAVTLKWTKMAQ
ncbi:MAG: hypothetical protein J5714_04770 [Alphaproteobacteria bacterium]|nr:hypothetical protein [Alphaproteobacteria bacterium]